MWLTGQATVPDSISKKKFGHLLCTAWLNTAHFLDAARAGVNHLSNTYKVDIETFIASHKPVCHSYSRYNAGSVTSGARAQ